MSEEAITRMSRATRGLGEAYTLLLLLAWNDVVTNGGNTVTFYGHDYTVTVLYGTEQYGMKKTQFQCN